MELNEKPTDQTALDTIDKLEKRKKELLSALSPEEQDELTTICNAINLLKMYTSV